MAQLRTLAEVPGAFTIDFDEDAGHVIVHSTGLWTVESLAAFFDAMDIATKLSRKMHGHARMLLDLTQAQVQPADLSTDLKSQKNFTQPGDRMAVVTASALLTMQFKRTQSHIAEHAFFNDRAAAESWLAHP
jgi:SpoIIAA-like